MVFFIGLFSLVKGNGGTVNVVVKVKTCFMSVYIFSGLRCSLV